MMNIIQVLKKKLLIYFFVHVNSIVFLMVIKE